MSGRLDPGRRNARSEADGAGGDGPTADPVRSAENWTRRYLEGRERVLGGCWRIPADPEAAAERVIQLAGGKRQAEQWAGELLASVRGRGLARG